MAWSCLRCVPLEGKTGAWPPPPPPPPPTPLLLHPAGRWRVKAEAHIQSPVIHAARTKLSFPPDRGSELSELRITVTAPPVATGLFSAIQESSGCKTWPR